MSDVESEDVAIDVITLVFRAYLGDQSMDHLSATLKRGGIKDLLLFFPPNKREGRILEEYFRTQGLPQVADWWAKKQTTALKERIIKDLKDLTERGESSDQARPDTA